jgi:hypothetical protein
MKSKHLEPAFMGGRPIHEKNEKIFDNPGGKRERL